MMPQGQSVRIRQALGWTLFGAGLWLGAVALASAKPSKAEGQEQAALAGQATDHVASCRVLDAELQQSYRGGCVDGLAQGHGLAKGGDGASYQGEFQAGRKSGYGVKLYANGDAYAGDWRNDLRHGQGVYEFGEQSPWRGDKYVGQWENDLRHGRGAFLMHPSGEPFYADWEQGSPTTLATPTLIRRKRAYEALAPVLGKVGQPVCSVSTDGASPQRVAYGQVVAVQGERIQVRVDTPAVLQHGTLLLNPRWDLMTDWMLCAP